MSQGCRCGGFSASTSPSPSTGLPDDAIGAEEEDGDEENCSDIVLRPVRRRAWRRDGEPARWEWYEERRKRRWRVGKRRAATDEAMAATLIVAIANRELPRLSREDLQGGREQTLISDGM